MAFNMGSLVFRMAADVGSLTKDMAAAKTAVERGVSSINNILGSIGLGVSFGSAIAGIKSIIDGLDDLSEAAQGLQTTAVALAEMRIAFREGGVDSQALSVGLNKLNQTISAAAGGSKEQIALFKQLGIEYKDLAGNARGTEAVLRDIADAFQAHSGSATKAAIASDFFGKSGFRWIPTLNQGSEALRKNAGLTEEAVREAEKLRQEMDKLAATMERIKNAAASTSIPWLNKWLEDAAEIDKKISEMPFWKAFLYGASGQAFRDFTIKRVERDFRAAAKRPEDQDYEFVPGYGTPGNRAPFQERDQSGTKKALEGLPQAVEDAKEFERTFMELTRTQQKSLDLSKEQTLVLQFQNGEMSTLNQSAKDILLTEARRVDEIQRRDALKKSGEDSLKKELDNLATIKESVEAYKKENAMLGMTEQQQARFNVQLAKTKLAKLELLRLTPELSEAEENAIQAQIDAQKELIDLMQKGAAKQESIDAAEAARTAWLDMATDIERAITDAMVQGWGEGKSIAKGVGDYIANYFKTVVARTVAQAMIGAVGSMAMSAASAFGGSSGASFPAMGGYAELSGGSSNYSSMLSMGMSGAGALGLFGAGGASGAFMAGLGGSLGLGATAGGGFAAAGSLMGSGTLAGGATGAVMGLGAAMPYLAAAYGLYRIISGVGTGRARGPAYQEFSALTGAGSQLPGFFGGAVKNPGGGSWQGGHWDPQLMSIIGASGALAEMFGGSINSGTQFGQFTSTSPDGKGAQVVGQVVGTNGGGGYYFNQNAGNADRSTLMQQMVPGMIMAGLQDANLPAKIKEYFNSVSASLVDQTTLDNMVKIANAANALAESFKQLGGPFAQLQNLTVQTRESLANLVGGFDALLQKMGGYYQAFYTQEEQQAMSLLAAQRELEKAGIDTGTLTSREAFRGQVEGLDLTTEEGMKRFAAYMNAAGAFAGGADLLAATGMNLRDFTAGAPNYDTFTLLASEQQNTTTVLTMVETAIRETSAQMIAALQEGMGVNVSVNVPAAVEVNAWAGTVGGGN